MSAKVYIAPVDARVDSCAQCLLKLIHAVDESRKISIPVRVGTRNVTRIPGKLRARINEHGVSLGRRFAFQHLVVQYSATFVERNDWVVRQLLFAHCTRTQERQLNLEFARSGLEGTGRGGVAQRAEAARLAQAFELIGSFHGPDKIQTQLEVRRIYGRHAPTRQFRKGIAE